MLKKKEKLGKQKIIQDIIHKETDNFNVAFKFEKLNINGQLEKEGLLNSGTRIDVIQQKFVSMFDDYIRLTIQRLVDTFSNLNLVLDKSEISMCKSLLESKSTGLIDNFIKDISLEIQKEKRSTSGIEMFERTTRGRADRYIESFVLQESNRKDRIEVILQNRANIISAISVIISLVAAGVSVIALIK